MKKRRGSILGIVLMLTMLLAIITAVVASNALQNYRTTNWNASAGTSRYIAFAGLQDAMLKLRENPLYDAPFTGVVPGQPELSYRVTVKNQMNLVETSAATGPRTFAEPFSVVEVPSRSAKIESDVIRTTSGARERSLSGIVGTAIWKPTGFVNAASAQGAMIMSGGSKTSAFDFNDYKDRAPNSTDIMNGYVDPVTDTSTDGAHVQTADYMQIADTSKAQGDVTMPAVVADSDVQAAQAAQLRASLAESAPDLVAVLPTSRVAPTATTHYTGDMKAGSASAIVPCRAPYRQSEAVEALDDFPGKTETVKEKYWEDGKEKEREVSKFTPMTLEPKAYKSIIVKSDQGLRLKAGQYYFSDEFKIDGYVEIDSSNGDVIIYVGKTMTVNGKINEGGEPATMQVYFTDEDKPIDPKTGLPVVKGFSTLNLNSGSVSTMVAEGANLISRLDGARLLGAVSGQAIWMKNSSSIEYDTNLKGRQMAGGSSWKLTGVYETVGR